MFEDLYTKVVVKESDFKINHKQNIMLIGSCFTEEIGKKLEQHGFSTMINPFGILYNPISICECIDRIVTKNFFTPKDTIKVDEYFYLFQCHGDYRAKKRKDCLEMINLKVEQAHEFLKKTEILFITLGTSIVYKYIPQRRNLGNCHKIDSKLIERNIIDYNVHTKRLKRTLTLLKQEINPNIKIIFTISPIRHWREGYRDNMISKSNLILTVHKLEQQIDISYFPSYETVMDELRDYRFYDRDLLHLNETAVNHIWSKFCSTYFNSDTLELNKKFYKLWTMKNHRPLNPDTIAYEKHKEKTLSLQTELQTQTVRIL